MWNEPPSRSGRGVRGSSPNASTRGGQNPYSPYRPYGEQTGTRMPSTRGRMPGMAHRANDGGWDEAEQQDTQHHHVGIAIFHDGNPGHLWRGQIASLLGEATLGAGVVMWLYNLIGTPISIGLAVASLGLPFLLAGPLAARFENARDPAVALKWIGRLRFVLALGLIAMHYHTILPVVYLLLFLVSYCGRLHDAAHIAAMRVCLAPGEPELVANDTHIGAALAAVVGPLLATLLYVLVGERILGVSIGAAVLFIISLNSENFLDTLPQPRRAFLVATPEAVALEGEMPLLADDEDNDDPELHREEALPEWYQQGPRHVFQAIGDIRAGLGLAGSVGSSSGALWALAVLALIGGGLAVLEVFYVSNALGLPAFYLGPLLACEGAGMALGLLLVGNALARNKWRGTFMTGMIGAGLALALLGLLPMMPLALALMLVLGVMNALAVSGARHGLFAGFDGIERRALAAGEGWVVALCGLVGALAFAIFLGGSNGLHLPIKVTQWSVTDLLALAGIALALAGVLCGTVLSSNTMPRVKGKKRGKGKNGNGAKGKNGNRAKGKKAGDSSGKSRSPGRLPALDGDEGDSDYLPATGEHEAWEGDDQWGGDQDEFAASYGYGNTGYHDGVPADDGYADAGNDDPGSRRSAQRPPPRDNRNRPRW
jgi:hypothetical protein